VADVVLRILGECVVEVGDKQITPSAPHLFALALYLAIERGRAVSRLELQELIFPDAATPQHASHSLRQSLYRLRSLGVPLSANGKSISLADSAVLAPRERLLRLGRAHRQELTARDIEVLPAYRPALSPAYSEWLADVSNNLESDVRSLLLGDLRSLRDEASWSAVACVAQCLRRVDPANEEVVAALAEALALTGRKAEALDLLDAFLAEHDGLPDLLSVRRLRRRIGEVRSPRRQGTLRGRSECLAFLRQQWDDASLGRPTLSALIGAAGIGKTRVAAEFSSHVALHGAQCLWHTCEARDREQPLSLFAHLLPRMRELRGSLGASPALQPYLDRLLTQERAAPTGGLDALSSEALRREIQLAISDLVEAIASEQRLLIVVDDAHLLDEASWSAIRFLLRSRSPLPVMIVACSRQAELPLGQPGPRNRAMSHMLSPLSETDARHLYEELSDKSIVSEATIEWSVAQAAGNPFFIEALARQGFASEGDESLPFSIRSLASSLYFALQPPSRSLLEASLTLGGFATVERARTLASIEDGQVLDALRDLEQQGLLTFDSGKLRRCHDMLAEAIQELIPQSVQAVFHARAAKLLEQECAASSYSPTLAWAAAECWIAAGDTDGAARLIRQCAAHAASLGEPATGALMLERLTRTTLSDETLKVVLDDLIEYADVGGRLALVRSALQQRLELSDRLRESRDLREAIRLRLIEKGFYIDGRFEEGVTRLAQMLADESHEPTLRLSAGIYLLIAADAELDERMGTETFATLSPLLQQLPTHHTLRVSAELIFHTVFGDISKAIGLTERLISLFPEPALAYEARRAREHAAFALNRLGHYSASNAILTKNYWFMHDHNVLSQATYSASLLAENAISAGEHKTAEHWLTRVDDAVADAEQRTVNSSPGYYSSCAHLAARSGRYEDALALMQRETSEYSLMATPRLHSMATTMRLRIEQLGGIGSPEQGALLQNLRSLYDRAGHLGGQDRTVEVLWHHLMSSGQAREASALLRDYLLNRRRENTQPEWSLRTSTSADRAWQAYERSVRAPLDDKNYRLAVADISSNSR
jgi:DNA-binding SARP family transcriptional activator